MSKHIKNVIAALAPAGADTDAIFADTITRNGPEKVQKAGDKIGQAYDGSDASFNDFLSQMMAGGDPSVGSGDPLATLDNQGDGSDLTDEELNAQLDELIGSLCGTGDDDL